MSDYQSSPTPPAVHATRSTMAIVSLISGILGWTLLPFLGSIVAVITGHKAKKEIRDSMGQLGDAGMATAGLVLGYIGLALVLCVCAAVVAVMALGMSQSIATG
ncbi:MAG: DUF4190 domain-containing protein [Syntrophaceae bacterium]|nr:DUF4190 domain-containing protein [Syntrophaceae bacterium]